MANYKLITQSSVQTTSQLMFTATATNTVVSSITVKDSSGQTAEVLIQKSGGSIIELAEVALTSNGGTQLIDVAFALEAGDKVFTRASRSGMKFIMSYVEETDIPNATALGGLADVDTTGAGDGQSLVYNGSSAQWEPVTVTGGTGGGAGQLDDLSDVAITSAASGHILRYNGSGFVNVTPTTAMIQEATGSKYLSITNEQKLDNITVTGAADLDDIATNSAKVSFPGFGTTAGTALEGDTALFSGAYADLTGKPALFDGDYNSLSNQPALFDGNYNSLSNLPALFDGDYNSLSNQPALFSGAYADLTGRPVIPTSLDGLGDVAISGLQNGQILVYDDDDGEFRNQAFALGWNDITGKPSVFTPADHTHVAADITDFNTKVDQRISAAGSTQIHETAPVSTLGNTNNGAELMELTSTNLTLVVGDIYSLGSTGWETATNTTDSADKMLAIPVNGNDDGSEMLIKGVVRVDLNTSGASIGNTVYLGTGNKATLTAPTSAAYVIKIGRVIEPANNTIFFNPDSTSIKVQ